MVRLLAFAACGQTFDYAPDVICAVAKAIDIVQSGQHDPFKAHERIKNFYNWEDVSARTEKVYEAVMKSRQMDLMERINRSGLSFHHLSNIQLKLTYQDHGVGAICWAYLDDHTPC